MFRKKSIDEWALDYWLLQRYARLCFKICYRKIEVCNLQNISLNNPTIIAPNHQNALMDAMTFVSKTNLQPVFLARADIFKGKRLTRFLTFLNIMPVYRIRDGIVNVKKNDEIFEKTVLVLHNKNNPLVLFPEGNHGDKRRLRPLVKGLFRIALLAQEKSGVNPDVKIFPVGLDYGHYQNFRSTLFVNVGDPIDVSGFYKEYLENPVTAINSLKDAYAAELSKLMIDIQTEEYYDLYMAMREIFNDEMRVLQDIQGNSLASRFIADKVMISILNEELEKNPDQIRLLNEMTMSYLSGIKNAGLRDWVIRKGPFSPLKLLISAIAKIALIPVFLFGFINNMLPYLFTSSRVKNVKDPQFHTSIKYVTGMIVFPIWYIVIAGILAFLALPVWFILLYVFLLPLTGLAAFEYFIRFKKLLAKLKFSFRKNSGEVQALISSRKRIISAMHEIAMRNKDITWKSRVRRLG